MNLKLSNEIKVMGIINRYKLVMKKNFGQNFIINPKVIEHIVSYSDIQEDDIVIEIGPGIGSLTEGILNICKEVYAFEIDKDLKVVLDENLDYPGFNLIMNDFLKVDLKAFVETLNPQKRIVIISNLPYYITSDILLKIVESNIKFKEVIVMLQKEVGDKFISNKGVKDESVLTYLARYYFKCEKLMDVGRDNFFPKPNVESVVLKFETYDHPSKVKSDKKFIEVTKALLKMRRKTIQNNLNSYLPSKEMTLEVLNECNIPLNTRAESLSLEDFILISNVIYDKVPK